jgi:D-inositol-3-phosphate glycosyltransferase
MSRESEVSASVVERKEPASMSNSMASDGANEIHVSLLTAGRDKPYAFGLATELVSKGVILDVVGGDEFDFEDLRNRPGLNFLNLKGDQRSDAGLSEKAFRVLKYYARLIRYTATAKAPIFHILWNNKFDFPDRVLLMLYYRFLGKKILFTAHNVNAGKRDSNDSFLNRLTLRIQYRLAHQIFVHTGKMKDELMEEFQVPAGRITTIPFGINNAVPVTSLSQSEARQRLGIAADKKTILFFGHITPYKGLEYLVSAFERLSGERDDLCLIVAGGPKNCETYWNEIQQMATAGVREGRILLRPQFIPDADTEIYFKAADVLVLPYTHVYQSGVLFLGYSFGLPALAADVGSLGEDIVEGETGFLFKTKDSSDLARTIERYFASDLFGELAARRAGIRAFANERHSWEEVGKLTIGAYSKLLQPLSTGDMPRAVEKTP